MDKVIFFIFYLFCKIIFSPLWLIIYIMCLFIYIERTAFDDIGFDTFEDIKRKYNIDSYWGF